jgi:hypothetical protein
MLLLANPDHVNRGHPPLYVLFWCLHVFVQPMKRVRNALLLLLNLSLCFDKCKILLKKLDPA